MSDQIKHECGIAVIRLLKPLDFYYKKYGTAFYAQNKLYLLMEKQHNRGQDGAGVANIKLDVEPGKRYISRYRSNNQQPIQDLFTRINERFVALQETNPDALKDPAWLKDNCAFTGELWLGHLRYGTFGKNNIEYCHPFLRQNNWMTRNLVLAGNFNMTNVDELFQQLIDLGQHPKEKADTVTVLEKIGHFLDEENDRIYYEYKDKGYTKKEVTSVIAEKINIQKILQEAAKKWDGGYAMAGLFGHGDAFVLRDPNGIRPAYYYQDDEVVVVASERPAIQTAFNVPADDLKEITPGHALIIRKNGAIGEYMIREPKERKSCSFERIYFSRGSDKEIYNERKELGRLVIPSVLEHIDHDLENTVFSFIPNTAEVAFYGLIKGVEDYQNKVKVRRIQELGASPDPDELKKILDMRFRVEKIAIKDVKMRTFITEDTARDEMVAHVYDVTYGAVKKGSDNLVVIDDSIVRGTTLRQSIIKMLDRLGPKRIIVVSSAPQIRYPDCYGIDMAKLGDFIAFRAAIALLKETYQENILDEVYEKAKAQVDLPDEQVVNCVKDIYAPFTDEQISAKIAEMLTTSEIKSEVHIIYQTLDNLHKACPHSKGDWYFSGDYPTPGGNRVVNRSFINFMEGKNVRAY